jgi:hypothetical protein
MRTVQFSVEIGAGPYSVGDEIDVTGTGIDGKATVIGWDISGVTLRFTFDDPFATNHYGLGFNASTDSLSGNITPGVQAIKRPHDIDILSSALSCRWDIFLVG